MNIWLPNHNMYISPAETIDTVNVSTSSFDAEQGMAGGAAVTVVTKSGTNKFRGSAFEFFMNDKMNASPFYFGTATKPAKLPARAEQLRRHVRRTDLAEQGVLLRVVRGLQAHQQPVHVLQRADRCDAQWRFQRRDQQRRHAADHLQSVHRQHRRQAAPAWAGTLCEQPDPANLLNPVSRHINEELYPLPNTTGIGLGGLTNNYQRNETRTVGSQELRRQGQLQPDPGPPALGQVQPSWTRSSTT